jgi:hypothetical protein
MIFTLVIDGADTIGELLSEVVALLKNGAFLGLSTLGEGLFIREEVVQDLLSISQIPVLKNKGENLLRFNILYRFFIQS